MAGGRKSIYQAGEYIEKNPTYHIEDSHWKSQQIRKMIGKHGLVPRTVCEIGCGAGEILKQLQLSLSPKTEFFGYEISPQAYALSKERENRYLHFFLEDLLAVNREEFDLLLCIDVVEHVENYMDFLRELRAKGHHKIFHIPLEMSVQWVLRSSPILLQRQQVGHLHYFTKETALATLQDTGYEIVDWFYTPGGVLKPATVKAKLASWPRRMLSLMNEDLVVRVLGGYSLLVLAR